MRLANGIVIDKEKTFGVLKFSALRREVHVQNEDGTVSEEIKERTYDLKCNTQGRMIQVSVPATVPLKDYDYNAVCFCSVCGLYNVLGLNNLCQIVLLIQLADTTSYTTVIGQNVLQDKSCHTFYKSGAI